MCVCVCVCSGFSARSYSRARSVSVFVLLLKRTKRKSERDRETETDREMALNGAGVLSRSILSVVSPRSLLYTVSKNASVSEAVDRMAEKNVGSLVVVTEQEEAVSAQKEARGGGSVRASIVGIFTERDFLIKMRGKCCNSTPVRDVMTSSVRSVPTGTSIAECMEVRSVRNGT